MISDKGLKLLEVLEGLELTAYPDPATGDEPWTIGIGTTVYANGKKVKEGDKITKEQAYDEVRAFLAKTEDNILRLVKPKLNQNQLDALLIFVYNVGVGNFKSSTLLKRINANPNDPTITEAFGKFIYAGGKPMNGLRLRRKKEAELYFS